MPDWPAGVGLEKHVEIDSTNTEALRRAAQGARGPLWVIAERQTAGRGRRGRNWSASDGDFAASLLISVDGGPAQAALRSFVAALGLFDALVEVTGSPGLFALKWPNDVLLGGGKLSGILLETGGAGALAIGVGVNLVSAPGPETLPPGALPAVSLRDATGVQIAPEAFLRVLAPALWRWESTFRAEGFAPVRTAWLAPAARIGEPVVARTPTEDVSGRLVTIDESGACIIQTPSGRVSLAAGDLFFGEGAARERANAACD